MPFQERIVKASESELDIACLRVDLYYKPFTIEMARTKWKGRPLEAHHSVSICL